MPDPGALIFVVGSLPAPPAHVLEVGAGDGGLAAELAKAGYDVVAIDPGSKAPPVRPVRLHELDEPRSSFDAAVAVFSMHHVEPLDASCRRLGEVVRSGGALVLDEIDFDRFDERAAGWWLEHHGPSEHEPSSPEEIVAHLRQHCHSLAVLQDALEEWFELEPATRGPYLYRWELSSDLQVVEERLIAQGDLPATGARIVGRRR